LEQLEQKYDPINLDLDMPCPSQISNESNLDMDTEWSIHWEKDTRLQDTLMKNFINHDN